LGTSSIVNNQRVTSKKTQGKAVPELEKISRIPEAQLLQERELP